MYYIFNELKLSSIAKQYYFRSRMLCRRSRCSGQYLHLSFIQEVFQAQADLCRSFNEPLLILPFSRVHLPVRFALSLWHSKGHCSPSVVTFDDNSTKLHHVQERETR